MADWDRQSTSQLDPPAFGHPTPSIDIDILLDLAMDSNAESEDLDAPLVLPSDFIMASRPARIKPNPRDLLQPPESEALPQASNARISAAPQPTQKGESRSASQIANDDLKKPLSSLQAKRARERARKKRKLDDSRGQEAERRVRFILKSLQVAHSDFLIRNAPHSTQGYVGIPDRGQDFQGSTVLTSARLKFLLDVGGYRLVDTTFDSSIDYPFVDSKGRVWAVVLAEPPGWEERRAGITKAKDRLADQISHLKAPKHRRGDFRACQYGFSFGMGRMIPMNFANNQTEDNALAEFFADLHVQSLFHFVQGGLRTWFPEHHDSFQHAIQSAQKLHPELRAPVPGSCFPASTVNVGNRVVCLPHRDASNAAAGVCLDYIDGPFDNDKGGHLVFHEARCIVKLRKGGVVLFPSAIVTHENIGIGPGEGRFSITGYFPGGINRYLDAGGKTLTEWRLTDPAAVALHESNGVSRWETGCARFKTAAELVAYWKERASSDSRASSP